jgi:hypothetical protein
MIFFVIKIIKLLNGLFSHLIIVDVELLVWVDEQENVSKVRVAAALLEALLQLLDHDVLGQVLQGSQILQVHHLGLQALLGLEKKFENLRG